MSTSWSLGSTVVRSRRALRWAYAAAGVTLCLTATAAAAEDAPPQKPATSATSGTGDTIAAADGPTTRPDWLAVQGGAVLFGVAYGAALVTAGQEGFRDNTGWLAIPAAGPWISLWAGSDVAGWALAADGIAQLGGGALITMGFANPETTLGPAQASERRVLPTRTPGREEPRLISVRGVF